MEARARTVDLCLCEEEEEEEVMTAGGQTVLLHRPLGLCRSLAVASASHNCKWTHKDLKSSHRVERGVLSSHLFTLLPPLLFPPPAAVSE